MHPLHGPATVAGVGSREFNEQKEEKKTIATEVIAG